MVTKFMVFVFSFLYNCFDLFRLDVWRERGWSKSESGNSFMAADDAAFYQASTSTTLFLPRCYPFIASAITGRHLCQSKHLPVETEETIINFLSCSKYLRSVRPLLDDEKYQRMEKLSTEFVNGIGRKLQRYLYLKRMWVVFC